MNPENNRNITDLTKPKNTLGNGFSSALFYLSILFFIIGFNFSDVMVGNWYQQFLPNLNGRTISDIFFLDSLTGWAVTPYLNVNDTSYVIKTTNSGNNWFIQHIRTGQFVGSNRIIFLNINTGYTAGVSNLPLYSAILKTTNGGNNWFNINPPVSPFTARDISVLNEDTIWVVSDNPISGGGVFLTTNGGLNWQNQLDIGSNNPDRIYMYNARIGFVSKSQFNTALYKTTNGGANWVLITNSESFNDMYLIDSLTGWKARGSMKKTTDGGLTWVTQQLPIGGNILGNGVNEFMNKNNDTIWAVGESIIVSGSPPTRGILYRTINGGDNWLYQIPDTSIYINRYLYGDFIDKKHGWAYNFNPTGIHTITGGNDTFITQVNQISIEIPAKYRLGQNYPNPFNPVTNIKYQIANNLSKLPLRKAGVKLVIYDIQGKQITELVNEEQSAGTYLAVWNAAGYASGIYFYSLIIDGKLIDTRKMILVK